jgi:hypothetical protein
MRVTELEATPSQTLVIEDQGIAPLGRGIAIERDTGGELFVTNATGRALRSVVLSMPDGSVRSTPRIGPGERVRSSDLDRAKGDLVQWRSTQTETRFGTALVRHLESPYLVAAFEELDGRALGDAWQAVSDASCRASSWFPSGVPVLLAELAPEPGRRVDAGRAVDQETTLIRVVGWGGLAP